MNKNKRVLVIDDEEAVRKSFCLALQDTPYAVTTAKSGDEGLLELENQPFDIIFLDLRMPGLNGVQTLRRIREKHPDIPIYIVTAFHQEFFQQLKQVSEEGMHFEVMQKPIGLGHIQSVTRSVVEGPLPLV